MHRLLIRQLGRLGMAADQLPDDQGWSRFLERISRTYEEADRDRYTLERSLIISSDEMQALYQRLRSSTKARLEAMADALPDLALLLDEKGNVIELIAPGEFGALFNLQEEPLGTATLTAKINEILPEEAGVRIIDALANSLKRDALRVVEFLLQNDGETRFAEGRVVPTGLRHEGQRTALFIARDITARRRVDAEARLIATVFEAANEGVVILDHKRCIVSVNAAFTATIGHGENDVRGEQAFFLEAMADPSLEEIWQQVMQGQGWRGELTGRHRNGQLLPLWLTLDPVRDWDGVVGHYVMLLTDLSEIERSRRELKYIATHDALTDLPNRTLLLDRLNQAIARTRRRNNHGALLFLDLDRFKVVNDSLGHHIGDALLRQVADRLQANCRNEDTLARLGGDEFVMIAEELSAPEDAAPIARHLLNSLGEPFNLEGYELDVSGSIGISVFPRDSSDGFQLIKNADTAMYRAKELGRDSFTFFTQELSEHAFEHFAMEVSLRKALERGELLLEYQPQLQLSTQTLSGLEALVRWQHPDLGLVLPTRFIPIAEVTGLIDQIGLWVLEQVCKDIQLWDSEDLPQIPMAVNLSRRQLIRSDLVSSLCAVLERYQIPRTRIEFEITENAIVEREELATANVVALRAAGFRLAIDDFGTGFSSLINLKRYAPDRLKIDKSFVRDVVDDPNDAAIVRAIIALGRSMQLNVIAEGVEAAEQLQALSDEGCGEVQGFHLCPPLALPRLFKLLRVDGDGRLCLKLPAGDQSRPRPSHA